MLYDKKTTDKLDQVSVMLRHSSHVTLVIIKKAQQQDYFNMCVLNEKSQSFWSYGLLHMCTNVQNLPVVTICQLKQPSQCFSPLLKWWEEQVRALTNVASGRGAGHVIHLHCLQPTFLMPPHKHTHVFTINISEVFLCPFSTLILMTFCYP